MTRPRQQIVRLLRQAGLENLASAAQATLPDPVEDADIAQFCAAHGLSADSLTDLVGGSP
jgi:hypothetical protein